jgi:hypothetical protein
MAVEKEVAIVFGWGGGGSVDVRGKVTSTRTVTRLFIEKATRKRNA